MISDDEFNRLCAAQFVSLTLAGGPTVQGYAAQDPDDRQLLRVDGLALENDGTVTPFSLRLERSQIESAEILLDAPVVRDRDGTVHQMRRSFFD